jgi:hypothetical protein
MERKAVIKFVEDNIGNFHEARLNGLKKLKLDKVLKRKNPYLFKAKKHSNSTRFGQRNSRRPSFLAGRSNVRRFS